MALNGKSEETPPKHVRLAERRVSRCLRKSLLPSSVRSKVSSPIPKSEAIMMRVFPAVKAKAEELRPGQAVLFEMLRELLKTQIGSPPNGFLPHAQCVVIELTAKTFPFSIPATYFVSRFLRAMFSAAHFF